MDKEHTAMERLRLASDMSLRLYKQPLMLTDSGGKDSAVICRLAENAGIPFEIVHSHTTADAPETVYHVRKRAKEYEGKTIRPSYYIADFVYTCGGEEVVEDAKGVKTAVYQLKKKLMADRYGILIQEV